MKEGKVKQESAKKQSLWDYFGRIPDHRQASGRRYALQSLLSLTFAAVLAGQRNPAEISRWGRSLRGPQLRLFGITRRRAPCQATYHNVFKGLDIEALEEGLSRWVAADELAGHCALDGKRLRGSRDGDYPGIHVLALYSSEAQAVLRQVDVPPGTNELTLARYLLKQISLKGKVVTGDALFTQRELCQQIVAAGGDYFFVVKENQERLRQELAAQFQTGLSPLGGGATGAGSGHGAGSGQGPWAH